MDFNTGQIENGFSLKELFFGKSEFRSGSVAWLLSRRQKEFYPPDTEYSYFDPRLLWSSEIADGKFFEKARSFNPDGYIVGVGPGAIFTLIQCFRKDIFPKGIVIGDKSPPTIPRVKVLVNALKESSTRKQMIKNLFELDEDKYFQKIKKAVGKEKDREIKKRAKRTLMTDIGHRMEPGSIYKNGPNVGGGDTWVPLMNIPEIVLNNIEIFHYLAVNDMISVVLADFIDPRFITAVRDLPGFETFRNIIYRSNIETVGRDVPLENLREYENGKNIFVDTTKNNELGLQLRVSQNLILP